MLEAVEAVWDGVRAWGQGRPFWRTVAVSLVVLAVVTGLVLAVRR